MMPILTFPRLWLVLILPFLAGSCTLHRPAFEAAPVGAQSAAAPQGQAFAPPEATPSPSKPATPGESEAPRPAERSVAPPAPGPAPQAPSPPRRPLAPAFTLPEEQAPAPDGAEDTLIDFNFDDADLYEVIRTIAEILNISYIVDANIQGKVTVQTSRKVRKRDLFAVFSQILEVNGLAAIKEGSLYRIVQLKEASRLPIASRSATGPVPRGEKILLQIIPLRYIAAQEMTKLLTPFLSAAGTMISHAESNTVLVVDKWLNMVKILRLVDAFDVDFFTRYRHRFYPLQNFDAEEMVKVLGEVFAPAAAGGGPPELKFIAISRLNTVLVVSTNPEHFQRVGALIQQMDIPSEQAEPQIYIYFVKNGEAKQLSELLKSIFSEGAKAKAKKETVRKPTNPLAREYVRQKKEQSEKPASAQPAKPAVSTSGPLAPEASGSLRGEVKITADEVRNALVIEAVPRDYRIVERVLTRLDVLPRQVLIEVMVAEITLDKKRELGIEWSYTRNVQTGSGVLSATVGEGGLNFAISIADKVKGLLKALATENKVNILSSPSVLASDNKEAKIDVSTEVPVASSQFKYTTTGQEPLTETTIQYRDTGVLLNVTPHINERGLVTMDITQEVSEQTETDVEVGGQKYPAFFKRSVTTSLTVKHGQTIVIGGLIKETRSDNTAGVPGLIRIPILRNIFGKESQSKNKTELIILITPHVITNLEDVDAVTEEFEGKVGRVLQRL